MKFKISFLFVLAAFTGLLFAEEAKEQSAEAVAVNQELENELIVSGFSNPNGEIFIIDDIKNILDEAEIIAHEDQHLKDFSDMCRLDFNAPFAGNRFECKSVRKGIFTEENSPRKYKRLKKLKEAKND